MNNCQHCNSNLPTGISAKGEETKICNNCSVLQSELLSISTLCDGLVGKIVQANETIQKLHYTPSNLNVAFKQTITLVSSAVELLFPVLDESIKTFQNIETAENTVSEELGGTKPANADDVKKLQTRLKSAQKVKEEAEKQRYASSNDKKTEEETKANVEDDKKVENLATKKYSDDNDKSVSIPSGFVQEQIAKRESGLTSRSKEK